MVSIPGPEAPPALQIFCVFPALLHPLQFRKGYYSTEAGVLRAESKGAHQDQGWRTLNRQTIQVQIHTEQSFSVDPTCTSTNYHTRSNKCMIKYKYINRLGFYTKASICLKDPFRGYEACL